MLDFIRYPLIGAILVVIAIAITIGLHVALQIIIFVIHTLTGLDNGAIFQVAVVFGGLYITAYIIGKIVMGDL